MQKNENEFEKYVEEIDRLNKQVVFLSNILLTAKPGGSTEDVAVKKEAGLSKTPADAQEELARLLEEKFKNRLRN